MTSRMSVRPTTGVPVNLQRAGVADRVRHVRRFSQEALGDVAGEIDVLYVDGAHRFVPARADLRRWGSRVPAGGRLLVHDSFSSVGVTLALAAEVIGRAAGATAGAAARWPSMSASPGCRAPRGRPRWAAAWRSCRGSSATWRSRCCCSRACPPWHVGSARTSGPTDCFRAVVGSQQRADDH